VGLKEKSKCFFLEIRLPGRISVNDEDRPVINGVFFLRKDDIAVDTAGGMLARRTPLVRANSYIFKLGEVKEGRGRERRREKGAGRGLYIYKE
jgi:hypothetical protein